MNITFLSNTNHAFLTSLKDDLINSLNSQQKKVIVIALAVFAVVGMIYSVYRYCFNINQVDIKKAGSYLETPLDEKVQAIKSDEAKIKKGITPINQLEFHPLLIKIRNKANDELNSLSTQVNVNDIIASMCSIELKEGEKIIDNIEKYSLDPFFNGPILHKHVDDFLDQVKSFLINAEKTRDLSKLDISFNLLLKDKNTKFHRIYCINSTDGNIGYGSSHHIPYEHMQEFLDSVNFKPTNGLLNVVKIGMPTDLVPHPNGGRLETATSP